ncbi:hypothetical protein TTHERM_00535440 (macronuclear) [Tetrahymena thermophila SB210]|uniref:Uncharacterized protein n=1 Tax=Tetrahymena thermophila (strain SB210) TaxID=312017 RepID=I7M3I4_TETTS|nr:hypothetical protein TTHERM_00535440 [Tetrahymena thermophila SB210]EAS03208.2 hypothetical protein TTHERM_00535440 [Tetrahymena thermophila SB210]|eukprot:XP_001023453.2 hypothetical protein TTHERM_00535440 [Tetrahymena thermophila SB210]
MSSSACERFVFDVCSANPNICKTCKNNKAMHADCAPVKREIKFGVKFQAHDTLSQYNSLPSKTEKKTPLNQQEDKKQENQESSIQKISQQPAPANITCAKPNDTPVSPQVPRNEIVQQPTSQENDLSRKVQQLIRDKEDKIKQSQLNQYASTPKRGSQASNTPSQRPSIASACQSICSGDSPTSQKSLPSSNFSTAAQKLQDQQDTQQQQQQDKNSNQLPQNEQDKINENIQSELKSTNNETPKINQEKNNPPTQNVQQNQNQQQLEQQNEKQIQQDQLDLKLKQDRERQEQQKIEKEKLAALLQKQTQETQMRNEEKPKPIQSNKGLTLAEILARQKQKIEQTDEKKNTAAVSSQQNQIPQIPKSNLTQAINSELNNVSKQPSLNQGSYTSVQNKSNEINNQISQQDNVNSQKNMINNQNQVEKVSLQKKPENQDDNQKSNTIILKPEEKKEQKPLSTVAQRIQELQKQQQQQQQPQIYQNQKVNLNQRIGLNSQQDNQKMEVQKELQSKNNIVNQEKTAKTPEIIDQQTDKNNDLAEKQTKQEQDQKVTTQDIKKPSSLVQQLQNKLGNLNFGVQPQISQNKQSTNQNEEVNQNDQLNIPFLKEQSSEQREPEKDFLDRPVMKKNVRSSRKMNLNDLKDQSE